MSNVNQDFLYTKSHEWLQNNGDGTWTLGISDNAQEQLGDMVFVELPEIDTEFEVESEMCVVESVKAASDVYAPCELTIIEVNIALEDNPELINSDCYGKGWLVKFKADSIDDLMDADAYQEFLDNE